MKPTTEMTYALGLRRRYCRQPVLELARLSSIIGMALVSALRSLGSDVVPSLITHHVSAGTCIPVPDHVVKGWMELGCQGRRSRLTSPPFRSFRALPLTNDPRIRSGDPDPPMCGNFCCLLGWAYSCVQFL